MSFTAKIEEAMSLLREIRDALQQILAEHRAAR